jgi:hypothetical protein
MQERERFFAWLPFYVNGSLDAAQRAWMQSYLEAHDGLAQEVALHEQMRSALRDQVRARLGDVPADIGYARTRARIAQALQAIQSRAPKPGLLQRFIGYVDTPAWRLAPVLVLVLLAVVGVQSVLLFERAPRDALTRGAPGYADGPLLRVNFNSTATESQIRLALIDARAVIVAGPTRLGDYYVKVAADHLAESRTTLARSPIVQRVDTVPALPEELLE